MKIKRIIFLFMTTILSLFASRTVSFDDLSIDQAKENGHLWTLKGEVVQVRGFWYPLSAEEGILASQPQLKSCCIRAPAKIEQQVVVKGRNLALLQPQRALSLEGIFNIEPAYNARGELVQLFVLEQGKEVPRESGYTKWAIAIVLIFIAGLWIIYWKKKKALVKNGN